FDCLVDRLAACGGKLKEGSDGPLNERQLRASVSVFYVAAAVWFGDSMWRCLEQTLQRVVTSQVANHTKIGKPDRFSCRPLAEVQAILIGPI
ncbi:MAG: hypothetical protein V7727_21740, partial [Sneathiella sp.]